MKDIPLPLLALAFLQYAMPHFVVAGAVGIQFQKMGHPAQLAAFLSVFAVSFVPWVRWPVVFAVLWKWRAVIWWKAALITAVLFVLFAGMKIWQMQRLKANQRRSE